MDDAKKQLIDKLQSANNILVTVSRNPSLDQLASCIGLTLFLNKQGKHAAAVFSGQVPSTLEFLKPGATLEKNTDSLRDFIISLDKSKADKLRYKVEEDVVRIFITPYKTSLSADDLEFSEGDFNVDVVVALGVKKQEDLDQSITAHGRILHDAVVASVNTTNDGGLGTINWHDPQASSLSELVTDMTSALDDSGELMDGQIATALLTGIVSETGRFSNDRTSSQTMNASAALLSAGANQQLVASKLEQPESKPRTSGGAAPAGKDAAAGNGELDIDHSSEPAPAPAPTPAPAPAPAPAPEAKPAAPPPPPQQPQEPPKPEAPASGLTPGPKMVTEPPKMGSALTANSQEERLDPVTDPMSMPQSEPPALLDHKKKSSAKSDQKPAPEPAAPAPPIPPVPAPPVPAPQAPTPPAPPASQPPAGKPDDDTTLADIEKSVASPHSATLSELEAARGEVNKALTDSGSSRSDEPITALNAQPLGDELHDADAGPDNGADSGPAVMSDAKPPVPPADDDSPAPASDPKQDSSGDDSDSPPPVPPPIPFQFGNNSPPPQQ